MGGRSGGWETARGAWRRPTTELPAKKRPRTTASASRMVRLHRDGSNALSPRLVACGHG